MPPTFLFDLSTIDLTKVVYDQAAIREINPQRGDMEHLDGIVYANPATGHMVGYKDVRADEFWVPGHIPGRPLLPGVIMIEAAAQLAAWLTSPETQLKAFGNAGTFPSQLEALSSDELASATNEYFNNAPSGEILTERAEAITVAPFKGPKYFQFHDALQNAVTRVFDGLEDKDTSWNNWVTEVSAF